MQNTVKLVLLALAFQSAFLAQAQEIDVNYGYQFGTKFSGDSDYLSIDAGNQLGLSFGWSFSDNTVAQITYNRHSSALLIKDRDVSPTESKLADLTAHWIMLNGLYYFTEGNITPFVGGGAGYAFVNFENENNAIVDQGIDSATRIAFSLKGGVTFWLGDHIGIKVQGDVFLPLNGFNLDAIFNEDYDGFRSAENIRPISPYLGLNVGLVARL